jgi:hypothetical protein
MIVFGDLDDCSQEIVKSLRRSDGEDGSRGMIRSWCRTLILFRRVASLGNWIGRCVQGAEVTVAYKLEFLDVYSSIFSLLFSLGHVNIQMANRSMMSTYDCWAVTYSDYRTMLFSSARIIVIGAYGLSTVF